MIISFFLWIGGCISSDLTLSLLYNHQSQPLNTGDSICSQYYATANQSSTQTTCRAPSDLFNRSRARLIEPLNTHHSPSCPHVKLCGHRVLLIHHLHALVEFGGCNSADPILSLTNNQINTHNITDMKKQKHFYTLLNNAGNEVQIDLNNYKITCNATGERKRFYHKYLADMIARKYENNIDLFRETYQSRQPVSAAERKSRQLQAQIERAQSKLNELLSRQASLATSQSDLV